MFRAISLCLLGALLLGAADAPPKSAFDKPTLEAYVRHLYLLPPNLTVAVGDPKPSNLTGFKEVRTHMSQGAQSQDLTLLVLKRFFQKIIIPLLERSEIFQNQLFVR